MNFAEKLDFLMNITNTTNSALALYVKLDASHISRLRRGHRRALKNGASLKAMSAYFARHCAESYQRKAIFEAMNSAATDMSDLSVMIAEWLAEEKAGKAQTIESFLSNLSKTSAQPGNAQPSREGAQLEAVSSAVSVYYGIEGKRRAAVEFLKAVIDRNKQNTLYLFSDEPTDWMTSDRLFAKEWAGLMFQILEKKNRIMIIHTISRHLDEMLRAITQWMPLYMSGLIEPYFYPKKRDGIFKRTLFIAPDIAAVVSGSVGDSVSHAANFLLKDSAAIRAHEMEFYQYLAMCKPLMRIFTAEHKAAYLDTFLEFEKEKCDTIIKTESLSLLTMPDHVSTTLRNRLDLEELQLDAYRKTRISLFDGLLKSNRFLEIIRLPDIEAVISNRVKVAFSFMLSGSDAAYTAREYTAHLEHIVHLLEAYENFHIYLTEYETEGRYMVYVKEDHGVIVAKTSAPPVVLAMREGNMNAAFWDYLKSLVGEQAFRERTKADMISRLTSYLEKLNRAVDMT